MGLDVALRLRSLEQKLAQPISSLVFQPGTTLEQALNVLRDKTGITIEVQGRKLSAIPYLDTDAAITLDHPDLETALHFVLDRAGSRIKTPLEFTHLAEIGNSGRIVVATAESLRASRVYDVEDIVERPPFDPDANPDSDTRRIKTVGSCTNN